MLLSEGCLRQKNKDNPRILNQEHNNEVKEHLIAYVQEHLSKMSDSTQTLLKSVIRRCLSNAMDSVVIHSKRYVKETFPKRILDHLICAVEKMLYVFISDSGSPNAEIFHEKSVKTL